jgi:hypothetical protein
MEMSGQLHDPAALPPKKCPRLLLERRLCGPLRAGLNAVVKRKKSLHCACRELNPGRLARSLVTIPTELSRLLKAPKKHYFLRAGFAINYHEEHSQDSITCVFDMAGKSSSLMGLCLVLTNGGMSLVCQ